MRIALGIEYDGTAYVGWQRQHSGTGVQALVEDALSTVANEKITVVCAGRTDTGVHATAQVVHFDTRVQRPDRGWMLGTNSQLPADINVTWSRHVSDEFHARFSAISRGYCYVILNRAYRSALSRHRAWWVHEPLDEKNMELAARHLLGRHDFSAFRAAGCQASTPIREISELSVVRERNLIQIRIRANAFLQHMVRNIVGTLVAVGRGDEQPDWIQFVLANRDRSEAGVAAPAHGLTLTEVRYPDEFNIPHDSSDDEIRL